jgi:hypothetical protein
VRFFAKLAVKARMVVRIHAALKCLRGIRTIKEPRRYAQRADPITSSPSATNLFSPSTHVIGVVQRMRELMMI